MKCLWRRVCGELKLVPLAPFSGPPSLSPFGLCAEATVRLLLLSALSRTRGATAPGLAPVLRSGSGQQA